VGLLVYIFFLAATFSAAGHDNKRIDFASLLERPIEVASSNPNHIDKWGYYYDGSTNYIIDPYFRDRHVLDFEKKFGPTKVMNRFTENLDGDLELAALNPKNFGKRNQNVYLNGNKYIKIKDQPIW